MRDFSLWRALLGIEKTVIERVECDADAELLVAHVRPESGRQPLRSVPASKPGLRRGPGPVTVADSGPGHGARGLRGRSPSG